VTHLLSQFVVLAIVLLWYLPPRLLFLVEDLRDSGTWAGIGLVTTPIAFRWVVGYERGQPQLNFPLTWRLEPDPPAGTATTSWTVPPWFASSTTVPELPDPSVDRPPG
jgi:hypothetical protein